MKTTRLLVTILIAGTCIDASAQQPAPPSAGQPQTAQTASQPAQPDPQMKQVLDALAALNPKPIPQLSPEDARDQPTPADAVKRVLKDQGKPTEPEAVGDVKNTTEVELTGHQLDTRIYTPQGDGPFPVILYFHGGGWVIADLDTYDASARALCNVANAVVVSVHYRQAPEHKFPAAHEDAYGAYQWVLENAGRIQGDAKRVAVVGESAGGNLAAAVCMMAKEGGKPLPVYQVLVYPIAGTSMDTPSYQQNAEAKPLSAPMMKWFFGHYLKGQEDYQNPKVALVQAKDLAGLPPATIINAEIDPLRSEGEQFAQMLEKAGVKVTQKTYPGVTHEFFGMASVVDKAREAQQFVGAELKKAFGGTSAKGATPDGSAPAATEQKAN